jgi:hypothetical protein
LIAIKGLLFFLETKNAPPGALVVSIRAGFYLLRVFYPLKPSLPGKGNRLRNDDDGAGRAIV